MNNDSNLGSTNHSVSDERRKIIENHKAILAENLDNIANQFAAGDNIDNIVRGRAEVMDIILKDIYTSFFDESDENLSLAAVGGYGRHELLPQSDIDILILIDEQKLDEYQDRIEQFLSLIWDLSIDVGHSVRTVTDCAKEAMKDVTVITNLMEGRRLIGSEQLFEQMRKTIAETHIWSKNDFFNAKLEEQRKRYSKSHDSAFRLEPNIKEGPGGLRDIQTIEWVAKRYFNADSLLDLKNLGFLSEEELNGLLEGRELLWRIRFALHIITEQNENRLLFAHQKELTKVFGYPEEEGNAAAEAFMQNYFRTVTNLQRLNEMLMQFLHEAIKLEKQADLTIIEIDQDFHLRNGYIEAISNSVFNDKPNALIKIFLVLQQTPEAEGIGAKTIRLIRNHLHLIDEAFRANAENRETFITIFRQANFVSHALQRMNRYGVLAAYIPAFANIVGRMQFDLFHIFTVDEHTLRVIRHARRFAVPDPKHENWQPLACKVFAKLRQPEILYLAALFHDIAKGRGGDHSELGAEDAVTFCLAHGLSQYESSTVAWLVKNHLAMSLTAQNKDISDDDVIQTFAHEVSDGERLDLLYLLTIADISATNPELLTSWKDSLLRELYMRTKRAINRGLSHPIDLQQKILERKDIALEALKLSSTQAEQAHDIWADLDDDYFLRHTGREIAWQTEAIASVDKDKLPLVLISEKPIRGSTAIFVYSKENDGFFAATTSILGRLNLNIVDARIITSKSGYAIDTYMVLDQNNEAIQEDWQKNEIVSKLTKNLKQPETVKLQAQQSLSRLLKEFDHKTTVFIDDKDNFETTLVHIRALDKPGLLAHIAQALYSCNTRIHGARISSIGEQADNYFYITDNNNKAISNADTHDQIAKALHQHIDGKI